MADKFDKVTASKMYARMKEEGCATEFIQEMILIAFPKADLEEVILCMADSIKNPPKPINTIPLRQRREIPRSSPSYQDSGCTGSSGKSAC